ncbi:MAG: hypothetical protein H6779_04235 [Candidatus Nomurabacteria bacterium]|nr:MAG: hypothetical protein H6779_04235 [Candidatus Nomurabacteria bacterium]
MLLVSDTDVVYFKGGSRMSALREALQQKGFSASDAQLREIEEAKAVEIMKEQDAQLKAGRFEVQKKEILDNLNSTSSIKKFRSLSRKLLLMSPDLVGDVVKIAHQRGVKRQPKQGGTALIAQLLEIRELLQKRDLTEAEKTRIVDRTLTKN